MVLRDILKLTGSSVLAAYIFGAGVCCGEVPPEAPPARNDYKMAMVVVSSTQSDTDESIFRITKLVSEQFPSVFNEATGNRITISIDPNVYEIFRSPSYITGTDNDLVAPAGDFVEKYNFREQFDFITLMFGFDTRKTNTGGHTSIFNTSDRIDNDEHPEYSQDVGSQRVIGLNTLPYMSCEQCNHQEIQQKVIEGVYYLSHEVAHQWGAYLSDFIGVPLVIKGQKGNQSHYNGTLSNLDDILNLCDAVTFSSDPEKSCRFWEPLGNSNYRMSLIKDACFNGLFNVTYSDLTLWAMGARDLDELTQTYLLVEDNNPDSYGYCHWPPEGTIVSGQKITAKEIILNHLEARE